MLFDRIFGINSGYLLSIILILISIYMKIHKKIIIFLCLVTLAGCVSTPAKRIALLKGPTYTLNGAEYVPLNSVTSAYSLDYSWDSIARKLILHKNNSKVVVALGSKIALVDNVDYKLSHPIKMHHGTIVFPRGFAENVLPNAFIKKYKKEVATKKLKAICPYIIGKIVIDPGHGGKDPGALGWGAREKDITLDISKRLKRHLERNCIEAKLTRSIDHFISLWRRADIANKENADFFVSIHANAARAKSAKGFEVFYLSEAVDDNARAIAAAENAALKYEDSSFGNTKPSTNLEATLWDITNSENRVESIELAKYITRSAQQSLSTKDRGVKAARFYVLKGARMPSILIEVGFISNSQEAAKLKSPTYRELVAKSIAEGISNYKREYEKTEGFTK